MADEKKWWKSRTVWFNVIGLAVAVAGELVNRFPTGIVAQVSGFVLTVGNLYLRLVTTRGLKK